MEADESPGGQPGSSLKGEEEAPQNSVAAAPELWKLPVKALSRIPRPDPRQATVARKNSPLTGRNLEQDQAHVDVTHKTRGGQIQSSRAGSKPDFLSYRGGQIQSLRVEFGPGFASYQAGNALTKGLEEMPGDPKVEENSRRRSRWTLMLPCYTSTCSDPTGNFQHDTMQEMPSY
ncbi:hypothetical protein D4764_18G0002640 [Takifugu flavidus]|uniref:Uncharacterized protein n=1 Tax=Takifugu flavidus TaxID=433684 RepID=A0A5C6NRU6_9TELE|nr:hypothetical protein D4764_18G0002640 [Takifugu flavidus]